MTNFMYGLRAPESRRQYPPRLKVYLDFLGLKGTVSQQASEFLEKAKTDAVWAQRSIMRFVESQKERASTGQIAFVTIRNYYKAIKLLCDMNEIVLGWKMITKGLPKQINASNDRTPNIEEIKNLIEYPDRRIKPIIFTLASSGIRLGAWDFLQWKHIVPIHGNHREVTSGKDNCLCWRK